MITCVGPRRLLIALLTAGLLISPACTDSDAVSLADARDAVAGDLCPQRSADVVGELIVAPGSDGNTWTVYVRARPNIAAPADIDSPDDSLASYDVGIGPGNHGLWIEPADSESLAFAEESRTACARLRPEG